MPPVRSRRRLGFAGEDREGRLVGVGRDDDLGEDAGDRFGRGASSGRFTATMPP